MLNTIDPWTADATFKVVPARGAVSNGQGLKEFHDMIVTVRARVKRAMESGRKEADVVAEHPTAEFDAKFGNGRVKGNEFVREVYDALATRASAGASTAQ